MKGAVIRLAWLTLVVAAMVAPRTEAAPAAPGAWPCGLATAAEVGRVFRGAYRARVGPSLYQAGGFRGDMCSYAATRAPRVTLSVATYSRPETVIAARDGALGDLAVRGWKAAPVERLGEAALWGVGWGPTHYTLQVFVGSTLIGVDVAEGADPTVVLAQAEAVARLALKRLGPGGAGVGSGQGVAKRSAVGR